jgi:hypothetical protein
MSSEQKPKYQVFGESEPSIFSNSSIGLPPTMVAPPTNAPDFMDTLPLPSILKKGGGSAATAAAAATPSQFAPTTQAPQPPPASAADFDKVVADYVAKNNPKLYILTPCYGSMCHVDYMTSMIQTIEYFRRINFPLQVEFCKNDSLVPRARNNLVARAMTDPACTHIMFIDSDIIWTPVDVLKLVLSEKDLCGGIYPLKHYHWGKLLGGSGAPHAPKAQPPYPNVVQDWVDKKNASQLREFVGDEDAVKYNMVRYNVNYVSNYLKIENNMAEVRHIATGFMMIRRRVFEAMFRAFSRTKYIDDVCFLKPHENANAYALFDCAVENESGTEPHYYSEDWLFCHRWRRMNPDNKIFIDVSIALSHCGNEVYHGSFINSIL